MDIEINEVQEIIKNLESGGGISIREEKYLKAAKLCVQLAAENVALKQFPEQIVQFIGRLGTSEIGSDTKEKIGLAASRIKTPASDRIVAWIKADGVVEFAAYQRAITEEWACKEGHSSLLKVSESAELFAKQLREGADK